MLICDGGIFRRVRFALAWRTESIAPEHKLLILFKELIDGPATLGMACPAMKSGGILVSVVSPVREAIQNSYGVRGAYFYADATPDRLNKIAQLFDSGRLVTDVGTVLPFEEVRTAHELLAGAPHNRGKIVLRIAA